MARKLVVCFDGTWNKPDDDSDGRDSNTNVCRMFESISGRDAVKTGGNKDADTLKWYDSGVGTNWYEHIRGGAFGYGLSRNIRQGYKFLIENYQPGDSIYIFGFSRGAYTARSLVGLIRNSGLLNKERIFEAGDPTYAHWKRPTCAFGKIDPDDVPHIMDAYQLYRNRDGSADTDFAKDFRGKYAFSDVTIRFLGVWDTVGALGIPFKVLKKFNAEHYRFHDQELSGIVEHAYHAIAIDEHRRNYDVTLWNPKQKVNQTMEQVWFAGAHADVGGGYAVKDHPLADVTLRWMQEKAAAAGLTISKMQALDEGLLSSTRPTDSYREFLKGMYRMIEEPHLRTLGGTAYGNECRTPWCASIVGYTPKNPGYTNLPLAKPD